MKANDNDCDNDDNADNYEEIMKVMIMKMVVATMKMTTITRRR